MTKVRPDYLFGGGGGIEMTLFRLRGGTQLRKHPFHKQCTKSPHIIYSRLEYFFNALKTTYLKPFALELKIVLVTYLLFRFSVISGATEWSPNFLTFIFVTFQISWPPISGQLFWRGAVFPDAKNLSPKGWFPYLIMWHFFEQFVQNRQKYATKNTW